MARIVHCIDNRPTEGFWGITKTEMYQMYEIADEASLRYAIKITCVFTVKSVHRTDTTAKHH